MPTRFHAAASATLLDVSVVVGAALVRDGRLLAAQRTHPPEAAGRWELPGGAVEPGEDEPAALARECREELGIGVVVGDRLGDDVELPGGRVLRVYVCTSDDTPVAREHAALHWTDPDDWAGLDWLGADRVLLGGLADPAGELRRRAPASPPS